MCFQYGPNEVLFTKPITPGVATWAMFENILAKQRARQKYEELHCYLLTKTRGSYNVPHRKPGSPSFASFFNANLDKWYE
jgi:hypothetical protein